MSVSQSRFTVAKLDAGMAILLTSDHHLIEFPSLLLPNGIHAGSIIDLSVAQNLDKEKEEQSAFTSLQQEIRTLFAQHAPSTPELSIRNTTQTSVVLEWNLLDLATADMRSLSLYKNGSKLGKIPNATTTTTKLSGLALDTEYTFQLVLKTTAGTFKSPNLKVKTHKMTNLTGLNICALNLKADELASLTAILERLGAKPPHNKVRIDTTHVVTTRGVGEEYKKAQNMNIPIVIPDFLEACEAEGRLMRAGQYYLDSDPTLRPQRSTISRTATSSTTIPASAPAESIASSGTTIERESVAALGTTLSGTTVAAIDDEDSGPPQRARGTDPASSQSQVPKRITDPNKGISKKGSQEFQKLASYLKKGGEEEMPIPAEEKGKGVKRRTNSSSAGLTRDDAATNEALSPIVTAPDPAVESSLTETAESERSHAPQSDSSIADDHVESDPITLGKPDENEVVSIAEAAPTKNDSSVGLAPEETASNSIINVGHKQAPTGDKTERTLESLDGADGAPNLEEKTIVEPVPAAAEAVESLPDQITPAEKVAGDSAEVEKSKSALSGEQNFESVAL